MDKSGQENLTEEEAWLCDGSVTLEGLEGLIESFFEAILEMSQ
jgi:hypothetical protein